MIRRGAFTGRNPVAVVGLYPEENTRTRWLTSEEKSALLAVIPERYARVAEGHKREAVEALARGERLQRSGTGLETAKPSGVAKAG